MDAAKEWYNRDKPLPPPPPAPPPPPPPPPARAKTASESAASYRSVIDDRSFVEEFKIKHRNKYVKRTYNDVETCVPVVDEDRFFMDDAGSPEPVYGRVACQKSIAAFVQSLTRVMDGSREGGAPEERRTEIMPPQESQHRKARILAASITPKDVETMRVGLTERGTLGRFYQIVTNLAKTLGVLAAVAAVIYVLHQITIYNQTQRELADAANNLANAALQSSIRTEEGVQALASYVGQDAANIIHLLVSGGGVL